MKKIILFAMLLIMSATSFSQLTEPTPALNKQDYLKLSKGQKTTAFIFLGIPIVAFAIVAQGKADLDILPVIVIGGGLLVLSSIPLFIASGKNKKRAMSMSFKNETAPQIQKNVFVSRPLPSLVLKISL